MNGRPLTPPPALNQSSCNVSRLQTASPPPTEPLFCSTVAPQETVLAPCTVPHLHCWFHLPHHKVPPPAVPRRLSHCLTCCRRSAGSPPEDLLRLCSWVQRQLSVTVCFERKRQNKLVKKSSSFLGCSFDPAEVVGHRKIMAKLSSVMHNASHPLHETVRPLGKLHQRPASSPMLSKGEIRSFLFTTGSAPSRLASTMSTMCNDFNSL